MWTGKALKKNAQQRVGRAGGTSFAKMSDEWCGYAGEREGHRNSNRLQGGGREKSGSVVVVGQLNMEHRESGRVKNTQRMW